MSSSEPKRLLGCPPTRAQLAEFQKSLIDSHSVPANKSIQQYFDAIESSDETSDKEWLQKPELPTPSEILGTDTPDDNVKLEGNKISGP